MRLLWIIAQIRLQNDAIYFNFRKIFNQMTNISFDFSGYYLIVLTQLMPQPMQIETISKILSDCWSKHIVNVNVLFPLHSETVMYTYFPFTRSHCDRVVPVVLHHFKGDQYENVPELFVDKSGNMHKCQINLTTIETIPFTEHSKNIDGEQITTGIDVKILDVIADRLNFSSRIIQLNTVLDLFSNQVSYFSYEITPNCLNAINLFIDTESDYRYNIWWNEVNQRKDNISGCYSSVRTIKYLFCQAKRSSIHVFRKNCKAIYSRCLALHIHCFYSSDFNFGCNNNDAVYEMAINELFGYNFGRI